MTHLANNTFAEVGPAGGVDPDEAEVDRSDDGDLGDFVVDRAGEGGFVGWAGGRVACRIEAVDELAKEKTDEGEGNAGADGGNDADDEESDIGAIACFVEGKVVGGETDVGDGCFGALRELRFRLLGVSIRVFFVIIFVVITASGSTDIVGVIGAMMDRLIVSNGSEPGPPAAC